MKFLIVILFLLPAMLFANEKLIVGGRLQGIVANDASSETQDMYLRRMRVNITYRPWDNHRIVYDVRNDNSNEEDKGDGEFVIGDAYWEFKPESPYINNIRFFRAKVDVSYSQTASSKHLFSPNRADTSEYASDFVVSNRRASNLQLNGAFNQLAYQVVLSDGVDKEEIDSAVDSNRSISKVNGQKLTYGLKLRYYFWGDAWENKVQDTFYGQENTFSLGVGRFQNDKIVFKLSDDSLFNLNRALTNIELSFAHKQFRLLGEYFAFENDIIDLDDFSSQALDHSYGSYLTAEYVFGKWAPNVGIENFDQSTTGKTIKTNNFILGINYYLDQANMRWGIFYKKSQKETNQQETTAEKLQLYAMLDF